MTAGEMVDKKRSRAVKRSKEAERRLAVIVGGWRNPTTGEEIADVETETEAYQVKSWETLPGWLHAAWEQAEADAARVGKIPILMLEERRAGGRNVRYYIKEESVWLKGRVSSGD